MEDVGGVDEGIGSHVRRRGTCEFAEVLLEALLVIAPREVGVALLEACLGKSPHHGRTGECLGEEDDIRVLGVDLGNEAPPHPQGLGVRVVYPEDRHAL